MNYPDTTDYQKELMEQVYEQQFFLEEEKEKKEIKENE